MFRWADFEAAAPELAAQGRELIERFRFVLVGTIRRDGMIPGTLKARDVQRDARIVLNSPVTHPGDPNAEFKLRGRAVEIRDHALKGATADAIEATSGWRPPQGVKLLRVRLLEEPEVAAAG